MVGEIWITTWKWSGGGPMISLLQCGCPGGSSFIDVGHASRLGACDFWLHQGGLKHRGYGGMGIAMIWRALNNAQIGPLSHLKPQPIRDENRLATDLDSCPVGSEGLVQTSK